ncbi:MAG: formate--tetrahydrofolate ligase [Gaiellales bacterium]
MLSSLEIAQAATLRPIAEVAEENGILPDELELYGRYKAKVDLSILDRLAGRPDAKLINVTAITPTPAGEGKTTTSVALTMGLGRIGRKPIVALREPSLGPVFGVKGGAAGGGYAQVVPMEDINLHFTGDIHAITAANNLLSALVDAHRFHGHSPEIAQVTWRRAIDVTDRSLRNIVAGLGGPKNGIPAESGFDITAASEVMAILALATDLQDLRRRLGAITVGYTADGTPVTAEHVKAAGAMAVLLKEAIKPNLVQTLEGQLCLMHAGPFANIAHGNNSIIADRVGLKLGEYLITESGFAADLGMEKFMDIVCRVGGLRPHVVVVVATVRALRHHGGGDWKTKADMAQMRAEVETGMANLAKHIENVRAFGIQPVVAINTRPDDEAELLELIKQRSLEAGAFGAAIHNGFGEGGAGVTELAEVVVAAADAESDFRFVYEDAEPIATKIEKIAKVVYGADGIELAPAAREAIARYEQQGLGHLPICMAKTHLSLSHDPTQRNRPTGFTVPIRDVRAYTGAGMLVPLCGEMLQMPGFGAEPAAYAIDLDESGETVGLF